MKHLLEWLIVAKAFGFSSGTIKKILEFFGSPQTLLTTPAADLTKCGLAPTVIENLLSPNLNLIEQEMNWAKQKGNTILTLIDPCYPQLLRHIADPPIVLYVRGNIEILNSPQIAMVGSRKPSFAGREIAFAFAKELVTAGLGITSGLANGIDAASHEGALTAGGITAAVLGNGLNRIYPRQHEKLASRIIIQGGAIVSEYPLDTPPKREYFPLRNRIISGLALGTLVVEAALQSGSLITARLANEQGREVFAIPGSLYNSVAQGCHKLIQQGAKLVTHVADILEEINCPGQQVDKEKNSKKVDVTVNSSDNAQEVHVKTLLKCIEFDPVFMDQIIARSGLSTAQVTSGLLSLELHGYINKLIGGQYVRVKKR